MAFRFRQFTIEDHQSTLRVGTDAMLLGSWAQPVRAGKILDIGTGCGVLALMMAQKCEAMIEAIDIDPGSVAEAEQNFGQSPWSSRVSAIHESLQNFSGRSTACYDFIITNPPYFSNSLKSPKARVNTARHDVELSLTELAINASRLLATNGCLAIILPTGTDDQFEEECAGYGLYPSRKLTVYPKASLPPKRRLTEFTKNRIAYPECSSLTILGVSGKYTAEYLMLTKEFHVL